MHLQQSHGTPVMRFPVLRELRGEPSCLIAELPILHTSNTLHTGMLLAMLKKSRPQMGARTVQARCWEVALNLVLQKPGMLMQLVVLKKWGGRGGGGAAVGGKEHDAV